MNHQLKETCPCCPNHCFVDNLKCGKGKAFAQGGGRLQKEHSHSHINRTGFIGSDEKHPKTACAEEILPHLIMSSGRYLHKAFHEGDFDEEKAFSGLSKKEQNDLKALLQKLLSSWEKKD